MRSEYGDDSEHLDPPSGDVLLDDLDVRVDPADRDAARQVDLRLRPDWDLDEEEVGGGDNDGDITHWKKTTVKTEYLFFNTCEYLLLQ